MARKKVVLAYSGGLDTACILKYLQEKNYDVIAYCADVGQQEDFDQMEARARRTGAVAVRVEDLKVPLVTEFIYPAVAGNAVYESRYLLGTALARPLIARRQVEVAREEGAHLLAHGATGKGNDQVRFELTFAALAPRMEVISPWKDREFLDRFQGRPDLLRYAEEHNLEVEATAEKPYSSDENLMHKSYEAGILEDPTQPPPPETFRMARDPRDAPDEAAEVEIHFQNALPTRVVNLGDGTEHSEPLALFSYLNAIGGLHGVGRIDMVENRFVGIKSRGVYETPGGTLLHTALRDLEGIAMDREVLRLRDSLSPKFAQLIYDGFWFSPEMDFIRAAFAQAQALVDGAVTLRLYKGGVHVLARESPSSLYDQDLSSMDVEGGYDQTDARGFIRIHSLRLKAHRVILRGARDR